MGVGVVDRKNGDFTLPVNFTTVNTHTRRGSGFEACVTSRCLNVQGPRDIDF